MLKGMHGYTTVGRYTETLDDGAIFEVVTTRRSELRALNHQAAVDIATDTDFYSPEELARITPGQGVYQHGHLRGL